MMNDGWPSCALEVTKIVAPLMRRGAILVNHNTVGLKGDLADYVAYVRDPANGFVTQNVLMKGEISVRAVDPPAAGGQELSQ